MKLLRHFVASFVLFAVLVGLLINVYSDIETGYSITKGDLQTVTTGSTGTRTGNIMELLRGMNLIEGIARIDAGISDIQPGTASAFDIVGALASVGLGVLQTVFGLLIAPYDIISIIMGYYLGAIPGVITGIVTMVAVYVGFILLSAYLRQDV